jgi:hypothetical protein
VLSVEIPASKLAGRKAAASCRTPKSGLGGHKAEPVNDLHRALETLTYLLNI